MFVFEDLRSNFAFVGRRSKEKSDTKSFKCQSLTITSSDEEKTENERITEKPLTVFVTET